MFSHRQNTWKTLPTQGPHFWASPFAGQELHLPSAPSEEVHPEALKWYRNFDVADGPNGQKADNEGMPDSRDRWVMGTSGGEVWGCRIVA